MSHGTFPIKSKLFAALSLPLSLALLGGCYHETFSYRAVPNVTVTRPYEPGSQGPLVLVTAPDPSTPPAPKHEASDRAKTLTAQEIAKLDPAMARLMSQKADADEKIRQLRAEGLRDAHPSMIKAQETADELDKEINRYVDKVRNSVIVVGTTATPEPVETRVPQTVLILSQQRDYGEYDRSAGRSIVMFFDGNPIAGEYWLNAENSVLITYSAYSAPARTRVGLSGSVKIIDVNDKEITADVAIRETVEADTTLFVEKPYDPATWEFPWIVTGRRKFQVTTSQDPWLRKAAVQWVGAAEKK